MNTLVKGIAASICAACTITALAVEPIFDDAYTADPAPLVVGDTVYCFCGHDADDAEGFKMPDWRLYSTKDMKNWKEHGPVATPETFTWARPNTCWAAQCVERDGKFYFYVTTDKKDGHMSIGVLVADRPEGPYHDPLGKPLVHHCPGDIDPTVLIDDDGQAYLYWGNPLLHTAKLNRDMISIDTSFGSNGVHVVEQRITDYQEGPWAWKRNGIYYMAFASTCCPEGIGYATSDSPLGPWKYRGHIMDHDGRSSGNHPGIIEFKGKWYCFGFNYERYRRNGGKKHCERRSVCVAEMRYNKDGSIVQMPWWKECRDIGRSDNVVYLDELGVSQITTGWGKATLNKSVEGRPLTVGGVKFKHGVGVHALSSGLYEVNGAVSFSAKVGIDDETDNKGSVKFIVFADGEKVAETEFLKPRQGPVDIKADLTGAKEVELFVCDALDGNAYDHADWCDAKFELKHGGSVNAAVGIGGEELGILTPAPSKAPRINGARVYGVRLGRPILWRAAVTGERPMEFAVSKLPDGLKFDKKTGVFSGAIAKRGDYDVVLTAKNAFGKAERRLTFKVGDKIALTPPMGWNSWNCFAHTVTDKNIRDTADVLISSGLADHGWTYVNIDDFWQNKPGEKNDATLIGPDRNPDGTIAVNKRFPDMKGLADYVHSKGLKIGLYSSPGPLTCGGCIGSWMHEWQDAKTYADWGYDYLKYDWCGYSQTVMGEDALGRAMYPYQVMGEALAAQGRDIVHSLCQYGMERVSTWGEKCGECWRTTGDINDSWDRVMEIFRAQRDLWPFAGPGAWNDPDMLVVGSLGWGNLHPTSLTPNEQYTHVSMWAMLCSPLLIGCDLTKLDDFTKSLLTNDEVIEVNQDEMGAQAARVQWSDGGEVWAKPMSDGSIAIALFNSGRRKAIVSADLAKLGLVGEWRMRDLWRQKDEGVVTGAYSVEIPRHCTKLVRLFPREGAGLKPCVRDIRNASFYGQFETKRPLGKPGYGTSAPCGDCPKNRAGR